MKEFFSLEKQVEAEMCKTRLIQPFNGEDWVMANKHDSDSQKFQQFGGDFMIVKNGEKNIGGGDGRNNLENFYTYGEDVLVPGEGKVLISVDGFEDKNFVKYEDFEQDLKNPSGNFIVIDHGNGEYSQLCHLKNGSLVVKEGDELGVGSKIAECGNSGNSTMPHLHYHVFKLSDGVKIGDVIENMKNDYPFNSKSVIENGTNGVEYKFQK